MPVPVSLHADDGLPARGVRLDRHASSCPPRGVNLAAFCSRLPITCARRVAVAVDPDVGRRRSTPRSSTPLSTNTARWSSTVRRTSSSELEPLALQLDLAAGDARDVEQVVDEPRQVPDLAVDDRLRPARLLAAGRGALEDVEAVADGRERVAQLVGEHRPGTRPCAGPPPLPPAPGRVAPRLLAPPSPLSRRVHAVGDVSGDTSIALHRPAASRMGTPLISRILIRPAPSKLRISRLRKPRCAGRRGKRSTCLLSIFGRQRNRRVSCRASRSGIQSPEGLDLWAAVGVGTSGVHLPDEVIGGLDERLKSRPAVLRVLVGPGL